MAAFDPFSDFDRAFNGLFRQFPGSPALPLDLYRKGDSFFAKIDLPGVDPGSIDIDVENRNLTIRAERKGSDEKDLDWFTHERPEGTFARQLTLGDGVDLDNIKADYADGVLTLTIPVAEAAKPRKISVGHGATRSTIEAK